MPAFFLDLRGLIFHLINNGIGQALLNLGDLVLLAHLLLQFLHLQREPVELDLTLFVLGSPIALALCALELFELELIDFILQRLDFIFEAFDLGLVLALLQMPAALHLALTMLYQLFLLLFQYLELLLNIF